MQDYQQAEKATNESTSSQSPREEFQGRRHPNGDRNERKIATVALLSTDRLSTNESKKPTLISQGADHEAREETDEETKVTNEDNLEHRRASEHKETPAKKDIGDNNHAGPQQSKTDTVAKEQATTSFRIYFVREGTLFRQMPSGSSSTDYWRGVSSNIT